MSSFAFLFPLLLGMGVLAVIFPAQLKKGAAMNRQSLGIALILAAICWWVAAGMHLLSAGRVFFSLHFIPIVALLTGIAFFFRAPLGATRLNQHGRAATLMIWAGVVLGLANGFALIFMPAWLDRVTGIYLLLGLPR
jgi:hypothetical protein